MLNRRASLVHQPYGMLYQGAFFASGFTANMMQNAKISKTILNPVICSQYLEQKKD